MKPDEINVAKLAEITTFKQVDALRLPDLIKHLHIIIGPNGMCLCGVYDGQALTCAEIVSMKSFEIRSASLISSFPDQIGKWVETKGEGE